MQINHLRYFTEVVRCGSISQAAQTLFISPQALSSSIANLENEMGCKLFQRHRQGMILTAAGQQVYEDLQEILPKVMSWFELGQKQEEGSAGKVRIYVALSLCSSFNRLLIQQQKEYPDLEIIVREARSQLVTKMIRDGKVHMGLISVEEEGREYWEKIFRKNGWTFIKLMEDEFCAVLGKDYFPEIKEKLTKEDCANMCYISSSDEYDLISKRFAAYFGQRMQSKSESLSSNLCMVALNEGVILLPHRIAMCEPLYQSGILRLLPIESIRLKAAHYLIYTRMDSASAAEKFFMEQIVEFYSHADWEQEKRCIK